jgi:hypothetical protein
VTPPDPPEDGPGTEPAYTVVSVATSPDGTPLLGFETELARAGEPLAFEFVLVDGDRFGLAVRTGDRLVVLAREEQARRLCRRLVEYERYDVGVRYEGIERTETGDPADPRSAFHEVTRHRLTDAAHDRLYERY